MILLWIVHEGFLGIRSLTSPCACVLVILPILVGTLRIEDRQVISCVCINMIKCSFDIGVDATPFAHTTFGAGIFTHISQRKQRILTGPVGQFFVPTEFFSHNDESRGPLISMTVPFYRTGVVVFGCKKSSEGKSTSSRTFGSTHRAVRSRRPSAIASVGPLIDLETPKLAPKINPNRWFL